MKCLIKRPYGKPLDQYFHADYYEMFGGDIIKYYPNNPIDKDEVSSEYAIREFTTLEELEKFRESVGKSIVIEENWVYGDVFEDCPVLITIYDDYIE